MCVFMCPGTHTCDCFGESLEEVVTEGLVREGSHAEMYEKNYIDKKG